MLGELGRRLLAACTSLVLGTREAADPIVRDLQRRLSALEDAVEHERAERKLILAEVEANLDQATRRYSKARAAEKRATDTQNGEQNQSPTDPLKLLEADPDAFDRWLLSGKPRLGG